MLDIIKKHLTNITKILHRKIFGHEISSRMMEFLVHLSWSFFGGVVSSIIMFGVNILAGRALGPFGFGQYNSLFSVASALSVFILFGNDSSSVRYINDKNYVARRKNIFSASFWLTFVQFVFLGLVVAIFARQFEKYLSLGTGLLAIGLALSLTVAMKNLADSYLRAFHLFKKQSWVRIASAFLTLFAFIFFFYAQRAQDYHFLIVTLIVGNLAFVFIGLSFFYKNFSIFKFQDIKLLFHYNKYLVIGTLALSLISLEQFLIGHFVGIKELGIYSAYWYGSFLVVSHLCVYFINIFWPSAIKNKDKMDGILEKIKKLSFFAAPVWIVADFILLLLILFLFGRHYPIRLDYLLLFPFAAYASALYLVFMHLLYIDRIKLSSVVSLVTGICLITFLAVFKNLPAYLVFQTVLYIGMTFYIFKKVKKDLVIVR